ncbi:MAG: hypothetical protein JJU13_19040 [Balneolaceae bacterium]|nr:hypothetical protein [Balneolaceae bacterium]
MKKGVTPFFKTFPKQVCLFFCLDAKEPKNQAPTAVGVGGGLFIDAAPFRLRVQKMSNGPSRSLTVNLDRAGVKWCRVAENTLFPPTDSRPVKIYFK